MGVRLTGWVAVFCVLACTGCNTVGPTALRGGRSDYNIAIQQTTNEQMLLNLVRLKYRDAPFFLEVSSVATQFNFDGRLGASATFPDKNLPANNVWGGSASVGYAEKPTVSYAPLQGDRFVKQVMAPIGPETLGVMYLLSQGVETPAEDAEAGRITITRDKNGRVFDWSEVLGGFFAVHSDGSPAAGRYASVRYRGHTFHIDDGDLDTKSTFSLLTQLFALQAGEIKMSGPALTLPVGQ